MTPDVFCQVADSSPSTLVSEAAANTSSPGFFVASAWTAPT